MRVIVQPQVTKTVIINQGLPGNRIICAAGAPSPTVGITGDVYINTTSGDLYQKTGSGWGSPIFSLGGAGGIITDIASVATPALIANSGGTIAIGTAQRTRVFLEGTSAQAVDPAIPDGTGTRELFLFVTSTVHGLALHDAANLTLYGGEFIGIASSILSLQWDNDSKWVETGRNQILE